MKTNVRSFIMAEETVISKSCQTRRVILDAAHDLIISQGYAATSIRQIAEGSGLAPGSIYNHFSSKEDIFKAILADRHPYHQIIPLLKDAKGKTIDEFIHSAARQLVDELGQHPEFINLMLIEVVEFKGSHAPEMIKEVFPELMLVAGRMAAFHDEMRLIPPPLLIRAFLGMFFSYFLTDLFLKGMVPALQENALDIFVDIFLHGIKRNLDKPSANTID